MRPLTTSGNPLVQVVGLFAGALVAVGAILLGTVLLALVLGLAVIAGLVLFVRVRWLRFRRGRAAAGGARRPDGEIVEVEYTVVEERTATDQDRGWIGGRRRER